MEAFASKIPAIVHGDDSRYVIFREIPEKFFYVDIITMKIVKMNNIRLYVI